MRLWRRRRRSVLVGLGIVVIGGILLVQSRRNRVDDYAAGERPEGLVDRLERGPALDHPPVTFTEIAAQAGLRFRHFPATRSNRLPEDMGSGVALGDVDGDGWTDVLLANLAGPMPAAGRDAKGWDPEAGRARLFLNRGDGSFEDPTEASGIDPVALANAAAFCDVDSDGDLDLFVTTYGTCRLFVNDGSAHFRDASAAAGLEEHVGFWAGVAVADYDRDGAMDVYVCGYVVYDEEGQSRDKRPSPYGLSIPALLNPSSFEPERNLLLAGNGDGTFREVSEQAGVADVKGRGLGALFCDLNADGLADLYVANDVSDNALYLNRGDGTFVDRTAQALVGDYRGAMGLAAGDFDGDLDLDLFITHWVAQENALYLKSDALGTVEDGLEVPLYFDEADRYGLGHTALAMVGWATRFFDYDNDGRLDLFVVNGSTIPVSGTPTQLEPMRSHLFWWSPEERHFFEVGAQSVASFASEHVGRGGATFDYDLDGDQDLAIVVHGGDAMLLRNDGGDSKPAVLLKLRQREGNRYAIGARVLATIGGRQRLEVVGTQGSYLSQHAVGEVSLGLGEAAVVEEIEVVWPSGRRESAGPFLAYSLVTWTEGEEPRSTSLPGRRERDLSGPTDLERKKRFYALREQALTARIDGNGRSAVEHYQQALALWPGHADCLYYLGNTYLELGLQTAALGAFERMVAFDERGSQGWMQIGLLRLPGGESSLDDVDRAGAAFQRCADLNSEESRPILQLGVVALLTDDLAQAQRLFMHAARLNPRSVQACWFGGQVAWRAGDRAKAAELLARAHELAGATGAGESASNEGDTRSGGALTAEITVPLDPFLTRWRSLGERTLDVEAEYGGETE